MAELARVRDHAVSEQARPRSQRKNCRPAAMKKTGSEVAAAIKEVRSFWRLLFIRAGSRRMLRVSSVLIAAGLTEGLTIALLIPLLRAINPASRIEGGGSRLDS